MSKPGKVLKGLCKKLGVRLTVKRNGKRVYKSVKVLKAQCKRKQKKKKRKVKKKKKKVRRKRRFGQSMRVQIKVSVVPAVRFTDMAGQDPNDGYFIISKEDLKEENPNFDPNSAHRITVDGDKIKHVHNLNVTDNTVGQYQHGRGYVAVTYKQYEVTHNNSEETIKWTPTSGTFDPNSWSSDYWFVTIH
jgi:hypothetical protein